MNKLASVAVAIVSVLGVSASAVHAGANPLTFKQAEKAPEEFYAVVEIPTGSFTKYETDAETGLIVVDRFQSMPVAYPTNYGSIVRSKGGDGDPLDVLIFSREPIVPGALIKVRPVGVMNMIDGGDIDKKIVAVPTSKIDPSYDDVKTIEDLPAIERERILAFFRVYKQLPEGSKVVEVKGFEGLEPAKAVVKEALDAYGK